MNSEQLSNKKRITPSFVDDKPAILIYVTNEDLRSSLHDNAVAISVALAEILINRS